MTALIVILWSIIGTVAGSATLSELAPLFGVRHMEGASAIFGVFLGAPLGLIAGGFFGYRMAARYGADIAKKRRFFLATLGGVAALIAAGFAFEFVRTRDYIDTQYQGARSISCRIRLAPDVPAPDRNVRLTMELRSPKETRQSSPYSNPDWKLVDGRQEAYSSVEAYRATPDRTLAITLGDSPIYLFKLGAPARPKVYSYESEWMKPFAVEGTGGGAAAGMEIKCGM